MKKLDQTKHLITHDVVLGVYKEYKKEKNPTTKKAIMTTLEFLRKNIGNLLILDEQQKEPNE